MNKYSVSQNFLINKILLEKIIQKCDFKKEDIIFDIGAGEGFLTEILSKYSRVLCFEIDDRLRVNLENKFIGNKNIEIHSDFLQFKIAKNRHQKIFSNIPFKETTKISKKVLIEEPYFEDIYLILQKEAAERLLGLKEGLLISLLILNKFQGKIIYQFKKTDFRPIPRVNSVLINFKMRPSPQISTYLEGTFKDFVSFIVMQQKPSIKERLDNLLTHQQSLILLKEANIDSNSSLYEIDKNAYFRLFQKFIEKFLKSNPEKFLKIINNSYNKYISINEKNVKSYRSRSAQNEIPRTHN